MREEMREKCGVGRERQVIGFYVDEPVTIKWLTVWMQ